jgi:hypothetical protein
MGAEAEAGALDEASRVKAVKPRSLGRVLDFQPLLLSPGSGSTAPSRSSAGSRRDAELSSAPPAAHPTGRRATQPRRRARRSRRRRQDHLIAEPRRRDLRHDPAPRVDANPLVERVEVRTVNDLDLVVEPCLDVHRARPLVGGRKLRTLGLSSSVDDCGHSVEPYSGLSEGQLGVRARRAAIVR